MTCVRRVVTILSFAFAVLAILVGVGLGVYWYAVGASGEIEETSILGGYVSLKPHDSWLRVYVEIPPNSGPPVARFDAPIPVFMLAIIAAALISLAGGRLMMRRARLAIKAGRCGVCGYDLRSTPDQCPECGTVFANGASDQQAMEARRRERRFLMFTASGVAGLLLAGGIVYWYSFAEQCAREKLNQQYIPPTAWVTKKLSVVKSVEHWPGIVPAKAGDEIWEFRSPPNTWKQNMGTGGKCLLRGGVPIDGFATSAS